jgi:5-formyltetrahydrofolate cyclo-ligase
MVVVPRVDRNARMLDLHSIADLDRDVVPGHLDIPEPRAECPQVPRDAIDFVLVPGVAFDLDGRRLGYGGGYYDRLLPLLVPRAARVAGAFDIQIVERVPAAAHDVRVDTIVTESRTIERTR